MTGFDRAEVTQKSIGMVAVVAVTVIFASILCTCAHVCVCVFYFSEVQTL